MDDPSNSKAESMPGPSNAQKMMRREPRTRTNSSSSSDGSSSKSSSSSSAKSSRKKKRHHRRSHKNRRGKHNRRDDLLRKLFDEVAELRKRIYEGGTVNTNVQSAATSHCSADVEVLNNDDGISLLDDQECRSLYSDEVENEKQLFRFDIQVKLKEPSVPKTPENYLKMLTDIQHFDKSEWCEVRYSEVQKNYNYSPGFTELEMNEEVKAYDSQRHLAYADKAYGALTFCALKQREALQSSMTDLISWVRASGNVTPDQLHEKIGELLSEGDYHKVSSDMLQLICGHRAETVQMRRDGIINFVRDPLVKSALRRIPPSKEHVFNSELLTSMLEKTGGVKKAFLPSYQNKPASQAGAKTATRYPSQGLANLVVPSQGALKTCCAMPYPTQLSQGYRQGVAQNRPSQGTGYNQRSRGSNHNPRGSFRQRGGNTRGSDNRTRGNRQQEANRKRTAGYDQQAGAGGKRGRF